MAATVLVSFSCAMQVQTFRKVGGYSYASTRVHRKSAEWDGSVFTVSQGKKTGTDQTGTFNLFGMIFHAVGAGIGGNL